MILKKEQIKLGTYINIRCLNNLPMCAIIEKFRIFLGSYWNRDTDESLAHIFNLQYPPKDSLNLICRWE